MFRRTHASPCGAGRRWSESSRRRNEIPAEQVPKLADRLVEACAKVTRAIRGREPEELL